MIYRKNIVLLTIFIYLLSVFSFADATFSDAVSANYVGDYIWNTGENIYLNGNVQFSGAITVNPGVNLRFNDSSVMNMKPGSSLVILGNFANPVDARLSTGQTAPHSSIVLDFNARATINYLNVYDSINGLSTYSADLVMSNCQIFSPTSAGLYIRNSDPEIYFTRIVNPNVVSIRFDHNQINFNFPLFYGCSFDLGTSFPNHFYIQANNIDSARNYFVEGNYWNGIAPAFSINAPHAITLDAYPVLSSNPVGAPAMSFLGAAGANGTFNNDFYLFSNTNYQMTGTTLTVANGATLYSGIDDDLATYSGGTAFSLNTGSNLVINNGGSLISRGTAANRNSFAAISALWNRLQLDNGSVVELTNTDIQDASGGLYIDTAGLTHSGLEISNCSIGVDIQNCGLLSFNGVTISNCTTGLASNGFNNEVTNCNFLSNLTNVSIISGAADLHNNYLAGGQRGVDISSAATVRDNLIIGAQELIRVNAAAAVIQTNTLNATASPSPKRGIYVSGAVVPNITDNDFIGCSRYIESVATVLLQAEDNWFESNPPVYSRFFGTGQIDYEPWLDDSFTIPGVSTTSTPAAVLSTSITPVNGAVLAAVPTELIFSTYDIGFYNGQPLDYWLQVDDDSDFSSMIINKTSFPAGGAGPGSFPGGGTYNNEQPVTYNLPGGSLTAGYRYYWRVRARDRLGTNSWSDWSQTFYFDAARPDVKITLSTSDTNTAAGDSFVYTIDFWNDDAINPMNNGQVVFALPEEVMTNGTVTISNVPAAVNVTVNAYSDIAGTTIIGQAAFLAPGAPYTLSNGTNWNNDDLTAAENVAVSRIDVFVEQLNTGESGKAEIQVINR